MARYRRYRKYSRRRHIWSSRISNIQGSQLATSGNDYIVYYNLCQNPAQSESTISQKYTVKNIHVSLNLNNSSNAAQPNINNLQFFVCYVPQGYIPTGVPSSYKDLPYSHPEWIMAHRFIGQLPTPSATGTYTTWNIRSRLSRKLDTGDRVVLIILGTNNSGSSYTLDYKGIVKYVTKSN